MSGLTNDHENAPVDYFLKHQPPQQHQQQHTPNSTHSSNSIKDELDEKRGRSISPSISVDGSYACSQCSASFLNRDQLEKHELSHSPNSTVVSEAINFNEKNATPYEIIVIEFEFFLKRNEFAQQTRAFEVIFHINAINWLFHRNHNGFPGIGNWIYFRFEYNTFYIIIKHITIYWEFSNFYNNSLCCGERKRWK